MTLSSRIVPQQQQKQQNYKQVDAYDDGTRRRHHHPRRRLIVILLFDRRIRHLLLLSLLTLLSVSYYLSRHTLLITPHQTYLFSPPPPETNDCHSYGCPVNPPEYMSPDVRRSLAAILRFSSTNNTNIRQHPPFPIKYATSDYVTLTRTSNRDPPINQDRGVILSPFIYTSSHPHDFLVGIFDGHGSYGDVVAEYAAKELPRRLADGLSTDDGNANHLSSSLISNILIDTFRNISSTTPNAMNGGCTASVIFRQNNNRLYIANTGDSTSFVATYDTRSGITDVIYQTRKDKAFVPEERTRIERAGGRIHAPKDHPEWSRVVAFDTSSREDVSLAMSRSFGDEDFKRWGVIPDPIVDVVELERYWDDEDKEVFVVVGSDGLFDSRRVEFVANHFANAFYGEEGRRRHLLLACEDLIIKASPAKEKWYRDDITVMAMAIHPS